ncbi:phage tail tube protein [Microbacterium sp. No. 7]|uniref:phage tail tube protein n=1 Tax=Microbacterium sp. No. 7 TaxID=1714373 RepID=UPI0006D17F54|nr:hypothetical protein [Microbacterium sp. No. 7]ALJ19581.1 hypothetical protein AOA12_06525 [Microbacterium sp. No. 7]
MADTRILTNNHFGWLVGPSSAIPAVNWSNGPTLAQLQSLLNVSEAVKIDGTDFGLEASQQSDDRSFVDAAGAQSRSFNAASGNIEIYTPAKGDTSSIYSQTWDAISRPRTRVVVAQRPVAPSSGTINRGDEINLFSAITDERVHNRNDASRTLGVGLLPQGDILVNYIAPHTTPTAPAVAPSGAINATSGTPIFLKVTYEGRNITIGAHYQSSNETVLQVRHGILLPLATGTATLNISYPGADTVAPITVTVT